MLHQTGRKQREPDVYPQGRLSCQTRFDLPTIYYQLSHSLNSTLSPLRILYTWQFASNVFFSLPLSMAAVFLLGVTTSCIHLAMCLEDGNYFLTEMTLLDYINPYLIHTKWHWDIRKYQVVYVFTKSSETCPTTTTEILRRFLNASPGQ